MSTMTEVVDDFDIDVDSIIDLYWQVHSSPLIENATDIVQTELHHRNRNHF